MKSINTISINLPNGTKIVTESKINRRYIDNERWKFINDTDIITTSVIIYERTGLSAFGIPTFKQLEEKIFEFTYSQHKKLIHRFTTGGAKVWSELV